MFAFARGRSPFSEKHRVIWGAIRRDLPLRDQDEVVRKFLRLPSRWDFSDLMKRTIAKKEKFLACWLSTFNINAQDERGMTLLHHAMFAGDFELVSFLLEQGANAFIRDLRGRTYHFFLDR